MQILTTDSSKGTSLKDIFFLTNGTMTIKFEYTKEQLKILEEIGCYVADFSWDHPTKVWMHQSLPW